MFFFWGGSLQMQKVLVLKNDVEVAQFQSNSPRYIPLSEELWKALAKLPSVYDYAAYRQLLERFGTHYLSEGSLGGSFKVVAKIDEETEQYMSEDSSTSINFLRETQIFTTQNQHCFSPLFNCFFSYLIFSRDGKKWLQWVRQDQALGSVLPHHSH